MNLGVVVLKAPDDLIEVHVLDKETDVGIVCVKIGH